MSSETIKVAILGAVGESARQILSGLLESKSPTYVSLPTSTVFVTAAIAQKDPF